MAMTEEQAQILFDGQRGTRIEFEDPEHGLCTVIRGKVGYTVHVANRVRLPALLLKTEDGGSLMGETE